MSQENEKPDDMTARALDQAYRDGYRRGRDSRDNFAVKVQQIVEAYAFRVVLTIPGYTDQRAEFVVLSGNTTVGDELFNTIKRVYERLQTLNLQPKGVGFEDCIVKSVELIDQCFGFTAPIKDTKASFVVGENGLTCVDPQRIAVLAGLTPNSSHGKARDLGTDARIGDTPVPLSSDTPFLRALEKDDLAKKFVERIERATKGNSQTNA